MSKKEYKKTILKIFNFIPNISIVKNLNSSQKEYEEKIEHINNVYQKQFNKIHIKNTLIIFGILNLLFYFDKSHHFDFFILLAILTLFASMFILAIKDGKYDSTIFGYVIKNKYLNNFNISERVLFNNMTIFYYEDDSLYSKFFFDNLNKIITYCDRHKHSQYKFDINEIKKKISQNNYDMSFLYKHYIMMKRNDIDLEILPFVYNKESIILLNEMNNSIKINNLNDGKKIHLSSKLNELNNIFINIMSEDFDKINKEIIKNFNIKSYEYFFEYKRI